MKYFNSLAILINLLAIFCAHIEIVQGIFGGKIAKAGQFKYHVSVQANKQHICGGSILSDNYVLSAAKCFIENELFKNAEYSVVAGVVDLKNHQDPGRVEVNVIKIFIPKAYKSNDEKLINPQWTSHNKQTFSQGDLAVVKLERELGLYGSAVMNKLNLPPRFTAKCHSISKYTNARPIVLGFGVAGEKAEFVKNGKIQNNHSFKLRFAKTAVLLKRVCLGIYNNIIDDDHICAQVIQSDLEGPSGVCYGDIGAPLVYEDEKGNKFVIGVLTTITSECIELYRPGIYTRITSYHYFIKNAMNDEFNNDTRIGTYITKENGNRINKKSNVGEFVEMFKFI